MKKEEILAMSRNENGKGDERDKFFETKSEIYATIIASLTTIIVLIVNVINGRDILGTLVLLLGGALGECIGRVQKRKSVSVVTISCLLAICYIYLLIRIITGFTFTIHFNF